MTSLRMTQLSLALAGILVACSSDDDPAAPSGTAGSRGNDTTTNPVQSGTAGTVAGTRAPTGSAGRVGSPVAGASAGTSGAAGASATGCPLARPVEASACTAAASSCSYDEIECRCASGAWSCAEPVDPNCPASKPVHAAPCTAPEATECDFLDDECECTGGAWSCESATDDAGVPADSGMVDARCPAGRPAEGSACQASTVSCTYEDNACACPSGTWQCTSVVDPTCPTAAPASGSACTGTADCDFLELECECLANVWDCKAND